GLGRPFQTPEKKQSVVFFSSFRFLIIINLFASHRQSDRTTKEDGTGKINGVTFLTCLYG
ncbi:MAG: hypothetical protein U0944_01580, partial [Candidatus Moranbacteria bacterium]|nr:hypothetical protein [Candidatus Moranbacteria bacterium]